MIKRMSSPIKSLIHVMQINSGISAGSPGGRLT
jgi:hypothetical protein